MKKTFGLALAFLVLAAGADAAPITFFHQGTGSYSLAGSDYLNASFTIRAYGDTDNRNYYLSSNVYDIPHDRSFIDIDGLGTLNFLVNTRTFMNNQYFAMGFSRAGETGGDLFDGPWGGMSTSWDMLTSLGPIFGNTSLGQWDGDDILTDRGTLKFHGNFLPGSFEAVVGSAPVPIPGGVWLLGSGLVGLMGFQKRMKKK